MDYLCAADRSARGRDLAIAGSALGCLAVAFAAPGAAVEGGPVICPFRLATGLPCPGCGLARSWSALAHGSVGDAFARHAFGPLLFVLALIAVVAVAGALRRGAKPVDLASRAGSKPAIVVAATWCAWWVGGLLT